MLRPRYTANHVCTIREIKKKKKIPASLKYLWTKEAQSFYSDCKTCMTQHYRKEGFIFFQYFGVSASRPDQGLRMIKISITSFLMSSKNADEVVMSVLVSSCSNFPVFSDSGIIALEMDLILIIQMFSPNVSCTKPKYQIIYWVVTQCGQRTSF